MRWVASSTRLARDDLTLARARTDGPVLLCCPSKGSAISHGRRRRSYKLCTSVCRAYRHRHRHRAAARPRWAAPSRALDLTRVTEQSPPEAPRSCRCQTACGSALRDEQDIGGTAARQAWSPPPLLYRTEAHEMTEQRPHAVSKRRRWRQTQRKASSIHPAGHVGRRLISTAGS